LDFVQKLYHDLEEQLNFIHLETENELKKAELSIQVTLNVITKLKTYILKYKFNTQHDEIYFFKQLKPKFLSRLIYFNRIYIIETHKPHGGVKIVRRYLNNELQKLKQYFDDNLEFYKYFRTGSNYLDHKYFLRGKHDIKLSLDSFYFETDQRFSTSHDFKVAKIISNDQVQVYLESELANLERKELKAMNQQNAELLPKSPVFWTGSKVALIELLYAFHAEGSFNNGKAELKEIADFIEKSFNVELGQFNRTFLELRARKTGRTKYLDSLRQSLTKRMDEADDFL
jgi:hypothetical protein